MNRSDDVDLINSDEILRSLTHRAAYRTISALRWVLLPVALTLIFIVKDESWNIAGYAVFAVFFFTMAVFEVLMAYDGVFKGIDQLRRAVVIDKATVYRGAAWTFIQALVFMIVIGHFMDDDQTLFDDVMQGILAGLILGSMHFYRWRHIVDKKSH